MNKSLLYSLILLLFSSHIVKAQWEPTSFNQSTWVLCQTENGNLLAANDAYPEMGGIFISEDNGATWTDTQAEKHSYTGHLVTSEHIYMGGVEFNIGISYDNGATWTNSNFSDLFPNANPEDAVYAIEEHNDRIYVSLFGHGVIYSEDQGGTWQLTDQESLLDPNDPENGGQWTYNLRSYNGKLYNIGSFGIWEYNETDDLWTMVDSTWYGSESLIVDDVLYVVYNAIGIPAGIRYTSDFQTWEEMPLPADVSTAVRTLSYYEGAFFMGHVNDAVFYTMDYGQNWTAYKEDFPVFSPVPGLDIYGVPMNFVFSEDTIYVGVFSAQEDLGGVYKAPVPEDVLSVNQNTDKIQVKLYPNPAVDFITIDFPQKTEGQLIIRDVTGRLILTKHIENSPTNSITIETNTWSAGLYLYSIEGKATKTSGKFLVE